MKAAMRRWQVAALWALLGLVACSPSPTPSAAGDKVIRLWIAPNPAEERFWTFAVERWNKRQPDALYLHPDWDSCWKL